MNNTQFSTGPADPRDLRGLKSGIYSFQDRINRLRANPGHQLGMRWTKELFGIQPREHFQMTRKGVSISKTGIFGRVVGPAFLAYSAYQGYQEGGTWGAAKNVGQDAALTYAFGRLLGGAAGTAGLAITGVAVAGYGLVKGLSSYSKDPSSFGTMRSMVRDQTSEFVKKQATLEMGTPWVDQFGTASTMRRRSLNAIMNSRINGRSALGNEAGLIYRPVNR